MVTINDSVDLPVKADPIRLAKRGVALNGCIDFSKFERLFPLLANMADASCRVSLAFSLNERGRCLIQGDVQGCLQLVCQRCLGPFEWQFSLPIRLAVLKSEVDEAKLPSGFEGIFLEEDCVNLRDAVEDEILLHLPNYPLHEGDLRGESSICLVKA